MSEFTKGLDVYEVIESFEVKSPWTIAYIVIESETGGFSQSKKINEFYTDYIPPGLERWPKFRIENSIPFWEFSDGSWNHFKSRAIPFTKYTAKLPDVYAEDIDGAIERIKGASLGC